MTDDENGGAGYRRPPDMHKFKKGRSGNSRGRPKGSKNMKTIIKGIARERLKVKIDGEQRSLTTVELVLMALRKQALEGKARASKPYRQLSEKYGMQEDEQTSGLLIVPTRLSPEAWVAKYGAIPPDAECQ